MEIVRRLQKHPRYLFLVDGMGALWSAFVTGVVLTSLQPYVGIPLPALHLLAAVPLLFVVVDLYAYLTYPRRRVGKLSTIAGLNLIYCLLSVGVLLLHREAVRWPGILYLSGEITVVAAIALFEYRTATRLLRSPSLSDKLIDDNA